MAKDLKAHSSRKPQGKAHASQKPTSKAHAPQKPASKAHTSQKSLSKEHKPYKPVSANKAHKPVSANKPSAPHTPASKAHAPSAQNPSPAMAGISVTDHWMFQCRPGFEKDLIDELKARFEVRIVTQDSGWVLAQVLEAKNGSDLVKELGRLIFPRQTHRVIGAVPKLPERDRAEFVAKFLWNELKKIEANEFLTDNLSQPFDLASVDFPDTNEGKTLSKFASSFQKPMKSALDDTWSSLSSEEKLHVLSVANSFLEAKLSVVCTNWDRWFLCLSEEGVTSTEAMGIPRLKFPKDAPSRSTLKLEEAFGTFLGVHRRDQLLNSTMKTVDLGASPGGWTYQFVSRGISVVAVDNGAMDASLMATGFVTHVGADGFTFQPKKPVDWMVCDIVDKPIKIVDLVLRWVGAQKSKQFIFNLKFPMSSRFEEVLRCEKKLAEGLARLKVSHYLRMKHLYFDRDEITCYLHILDKQP